MEIDLPTKLKEALSREAADAGRSLHAHVVRKLEDATAPGEFAKPGAIGKGLPRLAALLAKLPAVSVVSFDSAPDARWWVKLDIDLGHRLAWNVVQELGFALNGASVDERSPTVFMPVSPPPRLNGGPEEFLSWAIEPKSGHVDPALVATALEGSLPTPVDDESQWSLDDV
ncbi:MAG: hypothetical protein LBS70_01670 [Candidatus Accumulibacter sp.]|nr:hypothetical protein [Accumulibacter sp.]